ncbi:MAG: DUF5655 domain-containing protein, partial [Pyrinomonadaceae bacterium]
CLRAGFCMETNMAQKTSGEIEREFIDDLKKNTGKDLKGWLSAIDGSGIKKRNDIIKWLKESNGFGHMNASLLAGLHANGGKPVYADTGDLLENQFAKAADMRPLYETFLDFVKKNFPASSVLPKKTYVSILENREFAAVNIKTKELRIGFDLGDRPFDEKIEKAKLTGPMPRISHMFVLTDAKQLDKSIVENLRESHARCH